MLSRFLVVLVVSIALLMGPAVSAQSPGQGVVLVAEVDGVINPLTAQYLERVLEQAVQQRAAAVVLVLNTPGGLETAMRDMVQAMADSPIPVIVHVAPGGARATSAGLFITIAAHVAAMAPATHVGAAHPVPLGMEVDDVMDEKMTSDAAALARSLAATRGRNADWAERAVRENLSLTASEALDMQVIDLVVETLDALLVEVDGMVVETTVGEITLQTDPANVVPVPMTLVERLIHVITNPDIAYLLLSLATLLLLAELADPALSIAGVASAVAFILALMALGSLPINWAGVALLVVAVMLFIVALFTDTEVIVTIAALVPFVLGSLLLFSPFSPTTPAAPDVRVNPWLIVGMAVTITFLSLGIFRAIIMASRLPPQSGAQRLVGFEGVALSRLAPVGEVRVDRENWSAIAADQSIEEGKRIVVIGISGVRLQVRPVEPEN